MIAQIDDGQNTHNADVERAVLATILDGRNRDAWGTFSEICPDVHAFYVRDHQLLAVVIASLASAGQAIDQLSVADAAGQMRSLDAQVALRGEKFIKVNFDKQTDYSDSVLASIGGLTAIAAIADSFSSRSSLEKNAKILADYHRQRLIAGQFNKALDDIRAVNGRTKLGEIVDGMINNLSRIMGSECLSKTIGACASEALEEHDRLQSSGEIKRCGSWGLPGLDEMAPMKPGRLMVLAARPKTGKTSMMLQSISATLTMLGASTGAVVSLEMPGNDLANVIIGGEIGVSAKTIECGGLSKKQREEAEVIRQRLHSWDIAIKDPSGGCKAATLCSWIRQRHIRSGGRLKLVAIDYLQLLLDHGSRANETEQLGAITRVLKLLALELGITVLLLSQLNRSENPTEEPQLHRLRGSGCIEQDADAVVFLHDQNPSHAPSITVSAVLAKNRGGPEGRFTLLFERARGQRFKELAEPGSHRRTPMTSRPQAAEDVLAGEDMDVPWEKART